MRQERDLIDPADAQTMYAADWFSGVYRSADGGQSWIHINEGLRTRAVHRLAISSDGRILYAGKQGEGVFPLVMGARTPLLHNVYPDTGQVVRVAQGEQALFNVSASNLNGDEITYSWLLNDVSLGDRADFALMTDSLSVGDYQLILSVADEVSIVSARWQVQLSASGLESDFDGDGDVGFSDFLAFARRFGETQDDATFDAEFDLVTNGVIDFADFLSLPGSLAAAAQSLPRSD